MRLVEVLPSLQSPHVPACQTILCKRPQNGAPYLLLTRSTNLVEKRHQTLVVVILHQFVFGSNLSFYGSRRSNLKQSLWPTTQYKASIVSSFEEENIELAHFRGLPEIRHLYFGILPIAKINPPTWSSNSY